MRVASKHLLNSLSKRLLAGVAILAVLPASAVAQQWAPAAVRAPGSLATVPARRGAFVVDTASIFRSLVSLEASESLDGMEPGQAVRELTFAAPPATQLLPASAALTIPVGGACGGPDCADPSYDLWVVGAALTPRGDSATIEVENHGTAVSPVSELAVSSRPAGVTLAAARTARATRIAVPSVGPGERVTIRVPLPIAAPVNAPFCVLATIYMPGDPGYAGAALASASP